MVTKHACKITVTGVVQGVGFRPFVYQLALKNNLSGWVQNTSGAVLIHAEGEESRLDKFVLELKAGPPRSHIENCSVCEVLPERYQKFEIIDSLIKKDEYQLVSPDMATCQECRREIFDPGDRRFQYPFTNCTNCGPRFTIIRDIPYDRPCTTMNNFRMCPVCRLEYLNPENRRFHAQPNACPKCGPQLELTDSQGNKIETENIIAYAARKLKEGKILAMKGLGGFLLTCDATSNKTVNRLRERKRRPAKPFAIILKDLSNVEQYCYLSSREAELLESPSSPVVLLKRRQNTNISNSVAPGLAYLGIMLPYTPLHHLIMQETSLPLVMTSGNLSEEPIAAGNSEALERLKYIADYFVLHNRDIFSRYDDSVVIVENDFPQIVRRARGYAPFPIILPFGMKAVLACGAELKNTFCLTRDNHAFLSQHIGDMEDGETLDHFEETERLYEKLFRIKPEILACDLHPDYVSSRWAEDESRKRGMNLVKIQHHFAHVVSCMADNSVSGPVIGVSFDGSGYGTDGRIWGGEFVIADYYGFQRKAHFEYLPLPGGSQAIRRPYRTAIGYIYSLLGEKFLCLELPCTQGIDETEIKLIKKQIEAKINTPFTSSCGRLFDAVSSLTGIRQQVEYEGQAAIELEMLADEVTDGFIYPFNTCIENGIRVIKIKELISAIIDDIQMSIPVNTVSARFHNTIAHIVLQLCLDISRESGIREVALSGGVFQNRRLLKTTLNYLKKGGLSPLIHSRVPCNDGGISLGQAVIANFFKVDR